MTGAPTVTGTPWPFMGEGPAVMGSASSPAWPQKLVNASSSWIRRAAQSYACALELKQPLSCSSCCQAESWVSKTVVGEVWAGISTASYTQHACCGKQWPAHQSCLFRRGKHAQQPVAACMRGAPRERCAV